MANSSPVVIASNQSAIPVTETVTDIAPATQNITVVDSSSATSTGANNQTIVIGTPTAGSAASFTLSGIETVRVEVTGIWTGTLTAEISIDGGTTWTNQGLHQGAYTTSSFIAGFIGGANVSGTTNFRMRATAAMTGTAVVKIIESVNTQSVYIANAAPAGTVISVLNSTAATLTSGSVYTGTGEDVSNFSEMRVSVLANVASATDGLSLQQSSDNTNWDIVDTYTIAASSAGQGKTFVVPRQARYFRVVYTNGGTNQTSFRLQSILNRTATAPSSNRAGDAYTNETDLVQNQVFPMGYNGSTWDRLRSVNTGSLKADLSSVAGTATSVSNGTTDAGTTRVTLSSDSTGQVKLAAGSAVIGHVITDTGSTTAVTGNVTVVQPTGTSLHAVLDTTSTTAVTQPTAANLNATVVGTGTFATQATLSAETTKVIGTVNQGTSPWVTSNATTSVVGNGAAATAQRVTLANDSTGIIATVGAVTAITNALPAGTNTLGSVKVTDGTNTAAVIATINSVKTDLSSVNGITVLTGTGATGTGAQRVTIATDTATVAGSSTLPAGTNLIGKVGIDQTTVGTTNAVSLAQIGATTVLTGNGTAGAGAQRVTIASDNTAFSTNSVQSGTWTVQPGNTPNSTPWLVTQSPATAGGLSVYHLASAASTNLQVPKASSGQLYGYMVSNTSAAYSYLCFHNAATTPTAGASIFFKIGIPAGGAANVHFNSGIAFSTGIAISTVTGAADNNTTAVALNDLIINLYYK